MPYSSEFGTQWLFSASAQAPLLLVSEDQDSLHKTTELIKMTAVCESQNSPCTKCSACKQATINIHPDILTLSGSEKTIAFKDIHDILQAAGQTPWHKRKLLIIPEAQRLTREATNALLKSLEEPAATSRTLLTTSFKNRLLKTLLSRCIVMNLPASPLPKTTEQHQLPRFGKASELTPQELHSIGQHVSHLLHSRGFSPSLLRTYLRLRDYYKIKSSRGNVKLASEVLLSTLEQTLH